MTDHIDNDNMDNEEEIEELWKEINILHTRAEAINNHALEMEERVEELEEELTEMKKNQMVQMDESVESQLTTAERILIMGWNSAGIQKRKNKERAIEILDYWNMVSRDVAAGRLAAVTEIRDALDEIYEDESFDTKTGSRVANEIIDMTDGKFEERKDQKGRRCILQKSEEPWITTTEEIKELNNR